jgi:carbamoyltransferase
MIVTDYLGFKPGRHEGKVTGLAAHGDPSRAYASMAEALSYRPDRMDFHSRVIPEAIDECSFVKGAKGQLHWFKGAWAGFSREDIAAAAQQRLEDVVVPYVRDAVRLTGEPRVALAGGVFANVSLNRRIRELPEVEGVWVQPAMTDGGLAVGAALALSFDDPRHRPSSGHHPLQHVYLGPSWDDARIVQSLDAAGIAHEHRPDIAEDIAAALEQGLVVGHFDGALEFGPRALGHRSVLVAPTDPGINDRLNQRLHRTEFMPFAPAIQEEHAADMLQGWQPDHAAARFMTVTYEVTERFRELAPAAVHVDGTARPQVVRREQSPRLWEIIERYRQRTGIPAVINTSFNMHEEPIVGSPEDAIRSWREGAVDVLVMGERWVQAGS